MKVHFLVAFLAGAVCLFCGMIGCRDSASARSIAGQQVAFDAGVTAMKEGDFAAADNHLSKAIADGWLSADLQEEAYLQRAQARIELKEFDKAKTDIDWLQQRATRLDELLVVQGKLLEKQGNIVAAAKAFQEARRINPTIVIRMTNK